MFCSRECGCQSGEMRRARRRARELGDGRDRTGLPVAEPAIDVLFRPEEIHRASGVDDVVPPLGCGDEAVEDECVVVRLSVSYLERDRLAAVGHDASIRPSLWKAAQMPKASHAQLAYHHRPSAGTR